MITSSSDRAVKLMGAIYHPLSPINISSLIKQDERVNHSLRIILVQCVHISIPVTGTAKFLKLLKNNASMLISPESCVFEKSFLPNSCYFFPRPESTRPWLGGNTRMIRTWEPESGVSKLPGSSCEYVLNRIVQYMAHGKHTRYVQGWNNDRVG